VEGRKAGSRGHAAHEGLLSLSGEAGRARCRRGLSGPGMRRAERTDVEGSRAGGGGEL